MPKNGEELYSIPRIKRGLANIIWPKKEGEEPTYTTPKPELPVTWERARKENLKRHGIPIGGAIID